MILYSMVNQCREIQKIYRNIKKYANLQRNPLLFRFTIICGSKNDILQKKETIIMYKVNYSENLYLR